MVPMIRVLPGLVLATALCVGTTAVTAQAQTSGSIGFETAESSDPMSAVWTGCIIFFQGKEQGCSMSGLQVPITGIARVSGVVNNVKDIADVAGTYKAVGPDVSFGGGGHLQVKNDKGVTMTLWAFGDLKELQVGSNGMKVELRK
jgi:hypothetical protein